jgi:hypothetical protein
VSLALQPKRERSEGREAAPPLERMLVFCFAVFGRKVEGLGGRLTEAIAIR